MNNYKTSEDLSDPSTNATAETSEVGSERTPHGYVAPSDFDSGYMEAHDMAESKETVDVSQPEQHHVNVRPTSIKLTLTTEPRGVMDSASNREEEEDAENKKDDKPKLLHGGILFSTFYCILIIILGIAMPVNEALRGRWLEDIISAVFQVYLYAVSFLFLVVLEVYLTFTGRCRRKPVTNSAESPGSPNRRNEPAYVNMAFDDQLPSKGRYESRNGQLTLRDLRLSSRSSVLSDSTVFDDDGKTAFGRKALHDSTETTLYIRIVFIVLGLAAMVYDGLMIKQLQEGFSLSTCTKKIIFWPQYVHVGFLLVQCYFFFKHSQLKSLRNKVILRMGFIHVMATDINVMIRAFITQIYNGDLYRGDDNITSTGQNSTRTSQCAYDENEMMYRAAPYLYPCLIEYNFLAAALVYFMYSSLADVGVCCPHRGDEARSPRTEINCERTHKGIFFGIVLLAGTTVSVILFFAYLTSRQDGGLSLLIYQISELALHVILILTVVVAWCQTGRLKRYSDVYLTFEDGVLLASMSLGILFNVFFLQPVVAKLADAGSDPILVLSLTGSVIAVIAKVVQTWFIVDLSCRGLSLDGEWQRKPGRGSIMFLLLTNIAIWLLKTFQVRSLGLLLDVHQVAYGYLPWQLITDSLVPFLAYYYLYSSAGLARTWHQMYTDGSSDGRFDGQCSPKYDRYSKPAKEFEFVRQRRVNRAMRLGVDGRIVSPVSDV